MKLFNFHLMPYRLADLDAIARNGSAWVTFSNRHYDPQQGAGLYHGYADVARRHLFRPFDVAAHPSG